MIRPGLDNDIMHRLAPSIFADRPYHEVSDRYQFIPTIHVVQALRKEGWYPAKVQESRTRIEAKQGFTRHLVRFRNDGVHLEVGDSLPEIVLVNSHDRGCSFNLMAGIFRFVCSNGMVIQNADFGKVSVRHSGGDVMHDILEAVFTMAANTSKMAEAVEDFQTITLSRDEQGAYAEAAAELRWGRDPETHLVKAPFPSEKLLMERRREDLSDNLWAVHNRVQENLMKGGIRGVSANGRRRVRSRRVNSVSEDVRINGALWTLSEKMAELKAA
jgi:hypothetical protein